jgi:hypothetical protein
LYAGTRNAPTATKAKSQGVQASAEAIPIATAPANETAASPIRTPRGIAVPSGRPRSSSRA